MDKKLAKLKAIWDLELAKSGFVDIEQADGNLKHWDGQRFKSNFTSKDSKERSKIGQTTYSAVRFEAQQEYYQLAGAFLHDYKFTDERERRAWELHASGLDDKAVYTQLKKEDRKIYLAGTSRLLKRLSALMLEQCLPVKKT